MQHRAIETRYKGYRFRSRLEARWAVFFDALGWPWEYEPEGFELPGGVRYLPDFKVAGQWVEVKGAAPVPSEIDKMRSLCQVTRLPGMIVCGLPDADSVISFREDGSDDERVKEAKPKLAYQLGVHWREVAYAAEAARSARFEFGESGAKR